MRRYPPRPHRHIVPYRAAAQVNTPLTPSGSGKFAGSGPGVRLKAVAAVLLVIGVGAWQIRAWHRQTIAEERQAAERAEEQRHACALLSRALSVAQGQGRNDLAEEKDGLPPCERAIECPYLVELDVALIAAGREDLLPQLREAFHVPHCDPDLQFAVKHGVPAYRDMKEREEAMLGEFFYMYGPAISRYYNADH
jgi:hypothetical protein